MMQRASEEAFLRANQFVHFNNNLGHRFCSTFCKLHMQCNLLTEPRGPQLSAIYTKSISYNSLLFPVFLRFLSISGHFGKSRYRLSFDRFNKELNILVPDQYDS